MSVLAISRNFNETPQIVNMEVNVSLATVAGAGWLALPAVIADIENLNSGLWVWQPGDLVLVYSTLDVNESFFKVDLTTNSLVLYSTAGNGAVTLPVVNNDFVMFDGVLGALHDLGFSASDPTQAVVSMVGGPVVATHIAKFVDVRGTIDDAAGTAINLGDIQAGESGTAGRLFSFPVTGANGALIFESIDAGANNFTTVRNSLMGQSSVISIPDPGVVASNFLLTDSAIAQTIATGNLILTAGNLTLDVGNVTTTAGNVIAGSNGAAGQFQSFPPAAANGSLLLVGANAGANFTTTISNGAMAQSTVYVIPDAANANARFLVGATGAPFVNGNFPVASGTDGLMVDSGMPAAQIQDNTNILAKTSADIGGAGAGPLVVAEATLTAASVVVASVKSSTNPVSVVAAIAGAGSFSVTLSGDPGASCFVNYVAFVAAQ